MKVIGLLKKHILIFAAGLMIVLISSNIIIIIYNNGVLERAKNIQIHNEKVKANFNVLWNDVIRNLDLGLRGYAINKDPEMLSPYNNGLMIFEQKISELERLIAQHDNIHKGSFKEIKRGFYNYMDVCKEMLKSIDNNDLETFKLMLKRDKGFVLWKTFEKHSGLIIAYGEALSNQAHDDYRTANERTIFLQSFLALLGLPTLIFMIYKIQKDRAQRRALLQELDRNNKEFLFNSGAYNTVWDERELIENYISNLKSAASFISQISAGNFQVEYGGLNDKNSGLNRNNLAGELLSMREKMKAIKLEDERRIWSSEGLSKLSEIIRNAQHDLNLMCTEAVVFIVKYTKALQGGLFVANETEGEGAFLELKAYYAFDRKKYINKRIEKGEGLVGQAYAQKEYIVINEVPDGYITITSGLGEGAPNCILVSPMLYDDKVMAVIEITSFTDFKPHQIEFIEATGRIIASTIGTVKYNETTKYLLEQFKEQTEQLKAQEEELKQSMEELIATQESINGTASEVKSVG